MLVLRKECPSTFLLPWFLRGGEGSPPFGAPAASENSLCKEPWECHPFGTAPRLSYQPCDDVSQGAGKAAVAAAAALLCGGDLRVRGGGQSRQ